MPAEQDNKRQSNAQQRGLRTLPSFPPSFRQEEGRKKRQRREEAATAPSCWLELWEVQT